MDLSKVFSFQKNSPATENEINFSENNILGDLPEVYKQFLRETNGMVLNLCVLYDTDSIVEMYKVNEFAKYAPNYLSIGNDNGDRELVIKAEKDACVLQYTLLPASCLPKPQTSPTSACCLPASISSAHTQATACSAPSRKPCVETTEALCPQ